MVRRYEEHSLLEFQKTFSTGEACLDHLRRMRWPDGFVCPSCGPGTEEGRQLLEAIRTDGWKSYARAAKDKDLAHYRVVLRKPSDAGRLLPWVHRVIANAKSVIRGPHRGVSEKHLQSYLSEVCYRFNRRFWEKELFDRLIKACASTETVTYGELVDGKSL